MRDDDALNLWLASKRPRPRMDPRRHAALLGSLGPMAVFGSAWAGQRLGLAVGRAEIGLALGFWSPVLALVALGWAVRPKDATGAVWPIVGLGALGVALLAVAAAGVARAEWYGMSGILAVSGAAVWALMRVLGVAPRWGEQLPDDDVS